MSEMVSFSELEATMNKVSKELLEKRTMRDLYERNLKEIDEKVIQLKEQRDVLDKVRILFQLASDHARMQAKEQLETLVTNALQYVFGPMFRFVIELSEHGGNAVADFYVVTEWGEEEIKTKPQDSRGGGIVDIVSLALRIALLETVQPRLEGPILFDEPGKHVSEDYIIPMIEFIKSVGETFKRQIILVTHNLHLTESADCSYTVRLSNGCSEVTKTRHLDNEIA